jgi:DNA-binding transcriptional regulator LsrR (DeoR family)
MTNPLRNGLHRVDGPLLLHALDYISQNHTSTVEEVAEILGISRPTVQRLFHAARENFGVTITYQRTNQPYVGAGEFCVEDWGVFNRTRVRRFLEE